MPKRYLFLSLAVALACVAQPRDDRFAQLADRYFDEAVFPFDPVSATSDGFHQYDTELPSGSREEIQRQVAVLHRYADEVEKFDPQGLSPFAAANRELVLSQIRGTLLELESIRMWEKNPDLYSSGTTGPNNRSKSTWKASTAAPSSAPPSTRSIPATTPNSCGCPACRPR